MLLKIHPELTVSKSAPSGQIWPPRGGKCSRGCAKRARAGPERIRVRAQNRRARPKSWELSFFLLLDSMVFEASRGGYTMLLTVGQCKELQTIVVHEPAKSGVSDDEAAERTARPRGEDSQGICNRCTSRVSSSSAKVPPSSPTSGDRRIITITVLAPKDPTRKSTCGSCIG